MNPPMPLAAYRIDGELVSREAFYAVACDPRRSAVVEACAGAGKTWMLVSRILRALLDGAQPQDILAITFTRKAAGEMRERLAQWLAELSEVQATRAQREQALRDRGLSGAEAAALAPNLAVLHERLLAAGRSVPIHTFHAWFSQLLRSAPLELLSQLGLQPGMELVEDTADLEPELFRAFHAALLRDGALREDYATLVRERGRGQVRKWLAAALARRVEIELADRAGTLEHSVPPVALGAWQHPAQALQGAAWQGMLRELAIALGRGGLKAQEAATGLVTALAQGDARTTFDHAWGALFTNAGTPRKQLGKLPQLEPAQAELQALAQQVQAHEANLEHLRMVRLSRVLLQQYAALKRRRGLADMADLERCALELLRDSALAAWVQERLDARVRHLLIDEFQDTSPLQWQALHAWLAAYAGAGGGASGQRPPAVFIVGDPKQSIYRFRRAEPRVFDAARDFVRQGLGGSALACDHTRRNRPEVLSAVNAVFDAAQAEGAFAGFRAHTSEQPPLQAPAVFALPGVDRPARAPAPAAAEDAERSWRNSLTTPRDLPEALLRQQEAQRVAHAVQDLVHGHGIAPGDVMVLSRKRASLRLLADALQAAHLPFVAAEDLPLMEAPEVRDLVALLDVLASPQHDLSLAHALRSPLLGASDDDLLQLAQAARGGESSWSAALQAVPAERWSDAMRRAQALLTAWQEAAQRLPPHDLLDRIVAEGEAHARVAAAVPAERRRTALAAIDALLGQSLELDGGRYASPYGFVRALRRRALSVAGPADADAVQLLTVHGAKGLEARVVFVMDAEPEATASDTATLLVDWPVDAGAPCCCAFVASQSRVPPALAELKERERAACEREELNGLYVAMTRARERLVFSRTAPHRGGSAPSWWQRVAQLAEPWVPEPRPAPGAARHPAPRLPVLPGYAVPPAAPRAAAADSAATRLGQAVHRVLEWALSATAPAALPELARAAAREFGLGTLQAADVARFAHNVLHSAACRHFLQGPGLRWAGNEVGVAVDGQVQRIDRLVELTDGQWWVLDYKLAPAPQDDPANVRQLQGYRRAVAALQPGAEVRAAFITGAGECVEIDSSRAVQAGE